MRVLRERRVLRDGAAHVLTAEMLDGGLEEARQLGAERLQLTSNILTCYAKLGELLQAQPPSRMSTASFAEHVATQATIQADAIRLL